MYTLETLQSKTLKELKEIGYQLNVFPEDDRRYARNWIKALAGKQPPLLQLLEVSPVESEPIVNISPTINEMAIEPQALEPFHIGDLVNSVSERWGLEEESLTGTVILVHRSGGVRVNFGPGGTFDYSRPHTDLIKTPTKEPQAQEPPLESKFGRIVYPNPTAKPIAQNAETQPQLARTEGADVHHGCSHPAEPVRDSDGSETEALGSEKGDRVLAVAGNYQAVRGGVLPDQPTELITNYEELDRPPNRGDNGRDRIESEPKTSQSAIVQAAKTSPGVTSDLNPILTGLTLSDRFLATYPPYFGDVHYKADEDGQLNLLEPVTDDEPPDPDDFESLDAFNEAMARWDAENAEALAVSLDSMCEWAPCPAEWYEPEADKLPLKASSMSEVMEASPGSSDHSPGSSDHSESCKCWNFSIPTFDAWCDRANRQTDSDEPPDTGNYAKLPGPKPPKFPPRAIGQVRVSQGKSASRNYPETIPKLSHCIAAAGSSQPGRSPPGGDAM